MLVFPNCKINIGLRVTAKRSDGFHDLETIFYPVPWYDALEIIESEQLGITVTGIQIPGDTSNNLCIKAWQMLKEDFPDLPEVSIYLHKTIPAGAGLGGGSSNGAFMLKLLNQKFLLGLSEASLLDYALRLGSDCPFFIINQPALAFGRGEMLEKIPFSLKGKYLLLENPGIHVNTGWAFGQLTPAGTDGSLKNISHTPFSQWENSGIINDFQRPVISKYPEIDTLLRRIKNAGPLYAAMTGTGSTCFGIFDDQPTMNAEAIAPNSMRKIVLL
jgi:4-diphosphocytidyl-2-C-methyl-D-erythritol kinase